MDASWWENRYQTGDMPWDQGAAHPGLLAWLSAHAPVSGLRVLVPGCGLGHDARAWAAAGAHVTALDLAPTALATAQRLPDSDCINWLQGSIFQPPSHLHGTVDLVFEHTCFCAIDPAHRADYVRGVRACLAPGGRLLAIFYLNPGRDQGPPFGVSRDELNRLFRGKFTQIEVTAPARTFPGREDREELRLYAVT